MHSYQYNYQLCAIDCVSFSFLHHADVLYLDGKKYCELTVDSPNTSTWSDVERQLIARLDIDER